MPDGLVPCVFARFCPESRQRLQHYNNPPQRGVVCWAYQRWADDAPSLLADYLNEGVVPE